MLLVIPFNLLNIRTQQINMLNFLKSSSPKYNQSSAVNAKHILQ